MDSIRGVVERITYANEETGYSVIKARVKGYKEPVPVVGNTASVFVGTVIQAKPSFFKTESTYSKEPLISAASKMVLLSGIDKYFLRSATIMAVSVPSSSSNLRPRVTVLREVWSHPDRNHKTPKINHGQLQD